MSAVKVTCVYSPGSSERLMLYAPMQNPCVASRARSWLVRCQITRSPCLTLTCSGVKWLLEKTRDTGKYPLVLKENAEYGFRRNMLGGKWFALTLCVLPLAVAYAWDIYKGVGPQFGNDHVAAIAIAAVAVLSWLFFVTEEWVRDASHAYARALLATCEA